MKPKAITTVGGAEQLAKNIAKQLHGGEILALIGPLGSGKTTFTKALAKQLKVRDTVSSPTFVIMNQYRAKLDKQLLHLLHLDLYRTKTLAEVKALGLMEAWGKPDTVTVIEWADKIKRVLPKKTIVIQFRHE
jgi:tRNA threonylcarbamoyladenosine biosynthesis protein TsaE